MNDTISVEPDPATEVLSRLAQAQTTRKQARTQEQLFAITSRIDSVSVHFCSKVKNKLKAIPVSAEEQSLKFSI